MSNTGTYAVRDGELVKISDRIPDVSLPMFAGRWDKNRGCDGSMFYEHLSTGGERFHRRKDFRNFMKENHLTQGG